MTWYPSAIVRRGPEWKQGYPGATVNTIEGVVCHSAVGSMAGLFSELDRTDRRASWHFSLAKSGAVYQHYPLHAVAWHCGSVHWNARLIGLEHEGGPVGNLSEPLTAAQLASSVALVRWIAEQGRFARKRGEGLFEHREVSPVPTQCPSGRIPWAEYEGQEDDVAGNAYIVARGDTLGLISRRTGVPVETLVALNGIEDANLILVGQVLRLSADAPRPAAATEDDIAMLMQIESRAQKVREHLTAT